MFNKQHMESLSQTLVLFSTVMMLLIAAQTTILLTEHVFDIIVYPETECVDLFDRFLEVVTGPCIAPTDHDAESASDTDLGLQTFSILLVYGVCALMVNSFVKNANERRKKYNTTWLNAAFGLGYEIENSEQTRKDCGV